MGRYDSPWCYIAAVRLHAVMNEYEGRVRLRVRPFPLEVAGGEAAPRDILAQEWWLAALQEPAAPFAPYQGDDWPTTTAPAWCAFQQGNAAGVDYDLRVRRAFFAQSRNIGRREVLREIAQEAGLDLPTVTRAFASGAARAAVLEDARLGRDRYGVPRTPTVMRADRTTLRHPIAFPRMRQRIVVGVTPLPCCGESCLEATRALFEQALRQQHVDAPTGETP